MPANLTPQYIAAEREFRRAKTTEEKIECLKKMIALVPKHKGTEKIQADLKRRLAKLNQALQQKQGGGKRGDLFLIKKQGAGQVVLLGAPNVGKSQILASLTNASTEVADYPFTTHRPIPGMMPYKDIQIQLIDTPPLTKEPPSSWFPSVVQRADAVMIVADLGSDDVLDHLDSTFQILEKRKIKLVKRVPLEDDENDSFAYYKTTLIACNKRDAEDAAERLEMLTELYGRNHLLLPISAKEQTGLDELKQKIFECLDVIRVYTKIPGKKADLSEPYVLEKGSTVLDLSRSVHKDFEESLKFARIWGTDVYDGQNVTRDHILKDGDIVELHL